MSKKTTKNNKRKTKRRLNIKKVFILALIIFLVVIGGKLLLKIKVANISVVGNDYVSDAKIIKEAGLIDNISYFGFNTKEGCENIKKISLINTCSIKRKPDFKFEIDIEENKPLFFYEDNNKLILSNREGIVEENTYGVPTLINFVPENVLNKFIDGLSHIKSDIIQGISEIEYTPSENADGAYIDEERFMLVMKDGNICYINIRNIDALNKYDTIFASLKDMQGYINFDSDFNNYIFKPFNDTAENESDEE